MNFLKRAVLAVTRKKGRSVIMFIIFAAIANMVLAGLAIQHATQAASVEARQKLGAQLTLRYNMQGALQKARAASTQEEQRPRVQSEPVTEDMAKIVASDKNIASYNYIVSSNGSAQGFKAVATEDNGDQSDNTDSKDSQTRGGFGQQGGNFTMPDVSVTGVSSTELVDEFKNGQSKLVSGRQITQQDAGKNVAMIEKNLADQDGLKVENTIKIKAARSDTTVTYTIVGIYQAESTGSSSDGAGMRNFSFAQPYNKIYTDYKSAIPLKTVTSDSGTTTGGIDSVVFNVNDPKNIDQVKADAKAMKIDWSKYVLDANDAAYQQIMGPIDNVASFSMTAVYIVAIAGAIILALILMLSVKERMYETGVLLSMGESKIKVIAQYVTEALIIAVLAFGLSIFSGRFIAQGVGNTLLAHEVTAAQTQATETRGFGGNFMRGQFGGFFSRNVQAIDSINIQITAHELVQMSEAGLIVLLLGTILPAATIMRVKPKAILTKAS